MVKLSVGSGHKAAEPDCVRLDISSKVNPDVVWDLNVFPYPFDDFTFSEIECFDVIEHLQDIPKTLEEFYRILDTGGILRITTPHFSCANSYIDPTHKWHLSYFSFDYFCQSHDLSYYSIGRYNVKKRHIYFQGSRLYKSIIGRFANELPQTYEQRWAWMFPAWFLYFELETIKN